MRTESLGRTLLLSVFLLPGTLVSLPSLFPVTPASAKMASPTVRLSLTVSPQQVSWPDAPEFEQRLQVTAGTHGLDGALRLRDSGWSHPRIAGSPFQIEQAWLEGPGSLEPGPMPPILSPIGLPGPGGTCYRGNYDVSSPYRLRLGPRETTTVVAKSRLVAAPLADMKPFVGATISTTESGPDSIDVPLQVSGESGVLIDSRFVGAGDRTWLRLTAGERFRLRGGTSPALPNHLIRIEAVGSRDELGSSAGANTLTTVRTDGKGRFRSGQLHLQRRGSGSSAWALKASLVRPGRFDNTPSCAGAVTVLPGKRALTTKRLDGHSFRSVEIRNRPGLAAGSVRLRFFRHANSPDQPKRSYLGVSAGCNSMGARYRLANRKLRWIGPIMQTRMSCPAPAMATDHWLARRLKRGMKARLNGRHLTLTRGKTRIVLRQVR